MQPVTQTNLTLVASEQGVVYLIGHAPQDGKPPILILFPAFAYQLAERLVGDVAGHVQEFSLGECNNLPGSTFTVDKALAGKLIVELVHVARTAEILKGGVFGVVKTNPKNVQPLQGFRFEGRSNGGAKSRVH